MNHFCFQKIHLFTQLQKPKIVAKSTDKQDAKKEIKNVLTLLTLF